MTLYDVTPISDTVATADALFRERVLYDTVASSDNAIATIINTLGINNARALTDRSVRVDFTSPAALTDALSATSSYTLRSITAGSVEVIPQSVRLPPGQIPPRYVTLETTEHTNGDLYSVQLSNALRGQLGEVGGGDPFSYTGIGIAPTVKVVIASSSTTAIVFFTEAVRDNGSARNVSNYVWDNGLSTLRVLEVIDDQVTLQTTEQTPGVLYTLTVFGVLTATISDDVEIDDVGEGHIALLEDAAHVTDSITVEVGKAAAISESVSVLDTITRATSTVRSTADTAVVSDQIRKSFTFGRSASDTVVVTNVGLLLPNIMVATHSGTSQPVIEKSTDGSAWLNKSLSTPYPNKIFRSIGRDRPRGTIIAVGDGNAMLRSSDEGETWTFTTSNFSGVGGFNAKAVWWGAGKWIVGGAQSNSPFGGKVFYSTDDGVTWSAAIDPDSGTGTGPTGTAPAGQSDVFTAGLFAAPLGLHVAIGLYGAIWTSPDGITWTRRTAASSYVGGGAGGFFGLAWSTELGRLVACGGSAGIQTSDDGITWQARSANGSPLAITFNAAAWSPTLGKFALVGEGQFSDIAIQYSSDGITWSSPTLPITRDIAYSLVWDLVNLRFIASGNQALNYVSTNGTVWTNGSFLDVNPPFLNNASAITYAMLGAGQPPLEGILYQSTTSDTAVVSDAITPLLTTHFYRVSVSDTAVVTDAVTPLLTTHFYRVSTSDAIDVSDFIDSSSNTGNPYIDRPASPNAFDDEFDSGSADLAVRGYTVRNASTGTTLTRSGDINPWDTTGPVGNTYWSTIVGSFILIQGAPGIQIDISKSITLSAGDTYYARMGGTYNVASVASDRHNELGYYGVSGSVFDNNNRVGINCRNDTTASQFIAYDSFRVTGGTVVLNARAQLGSFDIRGVRFDSGTNHYTIMVNSSSGQVVTAPITGTPASATLTLFGVRNLFTTSGGAVAQIWAIDYIRKKTSNAWIAG